MVFSQARASGSRLSRDEDGTCKSARHKASRRVLARRSSGPGNVQWMKGGGQSFVKMFGITVSLLRVVPASGEAVELDTSDGE